MIEAQINRAVKRSKNYLPFSALMRLARLIGIERLRDIELLTRKDNKRRFRVSFSLDDEVAKTRENRARLLIDELETRNFGLAVLEFEQNGKSRGEALHLAGEQCQLKGRGPRSLQNRFKAFRLLVEKDGYISNGFMHEDFAPRYTKSGLKQVGGRPSAKTTQEKPATAHNNCLVFPPLKR